MRVRPRTIVLAAILAIIASVVWAVISAARAQPNPSVDYAAALVDASRAAQPPGENGWPHLIAAMTEWEKFHGALPETDRPDAHVQGVNYQVVHQIEPAPTPEDIAYVHELLDRLEESEVLAGLDRARRCPNLVRPLAQQANSGPLISVLLPELAAFRSIARSSAADLDRMIERGDAGAAARALERMLTLARACVNQTTLIDHLVGWAILSLATAELRAAVVEYEPGAETVAALQSVLDGADAGEVSLALEGERATFLDFVQRTFSGDVGGNGIFLISKQSGELDISGFGSQRSGPPPPGIANVVGYFLPRRRSVEASADAYYDLASEEASRTRAKRAADPGRLAVFVDNSNFLVKTLVPMVDRAIEQRDRIELEITATRLFLAIEAHRRAHGGAPPASIDALVPGFLNAVPFDPFAPDGQFQYRVVEGERYILYSVGDDEQDDGGNGHPRESLRGFTEPGFDYIINAPRARR